MELDKIENKIACGEMNAAQVFTQMKQHIDAANKDGYNAAVNDITKLMDDMPVDADTIRNEFLCK